jgi:hypothetical protein
MKNIVAPTFRSACAVPSMAYMNGGPEENRVALALDRRHTGCGKICLVRHSEEPQATRNLALP